jgi:hypothetical protein
MTEIIAKIREKIAEEQRRESAMVKEKEAIVPPLCKAKFVDVDIIHLVSDGYDTKLFKLRTDIAGMQNHIVELEEDDG